MSEIAFADYSSQDFGELAELENAELIKIIEHNQDQLREIRQLAMQKIKELANQLSARDEKEGPGSKSTEHYELKIEALE